MLETTLEAKSLPEPALPGTITSAYLSEDGKLILHGREDGAHTIRCP